MKRPIYEKFTRQFTGRKVFDEKDLFILENKYFLAHKKVRAIAARIKQKPFVIGTYLGKAKGMKFFPSIAFVNMIAAKISNKIWVDEKTAWLFICGRDIFAQGIVRATGHTERGGISIVLNQKNEVLGFGKLQQSLKRKDALVKNILDIGDFLRREK